VWRRQHCDDSTAGRAKPAPRKSATDRHHHELAVCFAADDLAEIAAWLVSDDNRLMARAKIVADGGW
jgi:NAD(P)-dependent dehydrogenase (short-subunit alcohol dehydrogenase family)